MRDPLNDARFGLTKRRGRDLNPRRTQRPVTVFETAAFDRSATPPSRHRVPEAGRDLRYSEVSGEVAEWLKAAPC
jgi:hypothetical protein